MLLGVGVQCCRLLGECAGPDGCASRESFSSSARFLRERQAAAAAAAEAQRLRRLIVSRGLRAPALFASNRRGPGGSARVAAGACVRCVRTGPRLRETRSEARACGREPVLSVCLFCLAGNGTARCIRLRWLAHGSWLNFAWCPTDTDVGGAWSGAPSRTAWRARVDLTWREITFFKWCVIAARRHTRRAHGRAQGAGQGQGAGAGPQGMACLAV